MCVLLDVENYCVFSDLEYNFFGYFGVNGVGYYVAIFLNDFLDKNGNGKVCICNIFIRIICSKVLGLLVFVDKFDVMFVNSNGFGFVYFCKFERYLFLLSINYDLEFLVLLRRRIEIFSVKINKVRIFIMLVFIFLCFIILKG